MNLFSETATQAYSFWAMLGGGLLAFVSPCVLPMLPVYALYLIGGTGEARAPVSLIVKRCAGLLCGFVVFFTLLGAGAGALGGALADLDRGTLNIISGVLMILFGLWIADVIHLHVGGAGNIGAKMPAMTGFFSSLLFGILLAISWTPCLTPVLSNALILAASQDGATMWTGIGSLAVFALGLSLPMIAVMALYQWLKGTLIWLREHQQLIRRIGGGLMVLYGAYLVIAAVM